MSLLLSSVTPDALIQFGGRLHPLLLHMPIGLFAAVALVEIVAIVRRKPLDQSVRLTLVWITALSAAMAMTSGLLLSREESYGSDALQTHKLLGIGVAVGSMLMAICASRISLRWAYALLLIATGAALIPAGHIGGTITHGDDFLTEPFAVRPVTPESAGAPRAIDDAGSKGNLFAASISPILHDKCVGCHSTARRKGGLSLETPDAIVAGAEAGPVIVAGDAAASELIIRLRLPLDDKQHMPPKSKPQPTMAEIIAIEQWIDGGAEMPLQGATLPVEAFLDLAPAKPIPAIPSPPDDAIAALRAARVHAEFVDPSSRMLWVDCIAAPTIDDAQAQSLLTPLTDFIADLSLAGTRAGDGALTLASTMPNLRLLDISRTACTPAGLRLLSGHASIEELRLTQTALDDSVIDTLAALPALKRVYLWGSGVSLEAANRLRASNSAMIVDVGASAAAEPLETEGAIALSGDAPLPGAAPPKASLAPANAMCPVSGKAINPKIAIVYEGAVIGFCCQDCAAKFWSEPEKYALPK